MLTPKHQKYSEVFLQQLPTNLPIVLHLTIKNFIRLTKNLEKPYSPRFFTVLSDALLDLVTEVQGCLFGYLFQNQIILIIRNDLTQQSEPWLKNCIQDLSSITASLLTGSISQVLKNNATPINLDLVGRIVIQTHSYLLPSIEDTIQHLILHQTQSLKQAVDLIAEHQAYHFFGKKVVKNIANFSTKEKLSFLAKDCQGVTLEDYSSAFTLGIAAYKIKTLINDIKFQNKWMINWELPKLFSVEGKKLLSEIIEIGYYEKK